MKNVLQNWRHLQTDRKRRKMEANGLTVQITSNNETHFGKLRKFTDEIAILPDDKEKNGIRLTAVRINGFHEEGRNKIHINCAEGSIQLQFVSENDRDSIMNLLREISSDQSSDSGASLASD